MDSSGKFVDTFDINKKALDASTSELYMTYNTDTHLLVQAFSTVNQQRLSILDCASKPSHLYTHNDCLYLVFYYYCDLTTYYAIPINGIRKHQTSTYGFDVILCVNKVRKIYYKSDDSAFANDLIHCYSAAVMHGRLSVAFSRFYISYFMGSTIPYLPISRVLSSMFPPHINRMAVNCSKCLRLSRVTTRCLENHLKCKWKIERCYTDIVLNVEKTFGKVWASTLTSSTYEWSVSVVTYETVFHDDSVSFQSMECRVLCFISIFDAFMSLHRKTTEDKSIICEAPSVICDLLKKCPAGDINYVNT